MESALVRSECESVSVSAGSCVTRLIYLTTRTAQGCPPPTPLTPPPHHLLLPVRGRSGRVKPGPGARVRSFSTALAEISSPPWRPPPPHPVEVAGYKSSPVQERQLSFGEEGAIFSESLRHYGGGLLASLQLSSDSPLLTPGRQIAAKSPPQIFPSYRQTWLCVATAGGFGGGGASGAGRTSLNLRFGEK